jgi:ankyrin repeat protein
VIDSLNSGWDVNELDAQGRTALFRAVEDRRLELINLLLLADADPNLTDLKGRTPLMASLTETGWRHDRMAINLLLAGADPSASSQSGETALIAAARSGNDWGLLLLAAAGADPAAATPRGSLANYVTHGPTLGILRRFDVTQTAKPSTFEKLQPVAAMIEAAKRGDMAEVQRWLDAGVQPDAILAKSDQRTALSWAANYNRFDMVDLLIARGANINRQSEVTGQHLLHSLAGRYVPNDNNDVGKTAAEIIRKLAERGANVNVRKKDGTTPLMYAAQCGVTGPNTQALLDAGADLNARNEAGLSVLGIAKKFGRLEMVAYLEKLGARD